MPNLFGLSTCCLCLVYKAAVIFLRPKYANNGCESVLRRQYLVDAKHGRGSWLRPLAARSRTSNADKPREPWSNLTLGPGRLPAELIRAENGSLQPALGTHDAGGAQIHGAAERASSYGLLGDFHGPDSESGTRRFEKRALRNYFTFGKLCLVWMAPQSAREPAPSAQGVC